ncbi:MAG: DUF3243 family protein [Thermaerobacterales bacterium]
MRGLYSETFRQMLNTLQHRVADAETAGMSMDEMTDLTMEIGDWLAAGAEPRTYEQRLLKEIWEVSDQDGRRAVSRALISLAARNGCAEPQPRSSI